MNDVSSLVRYLNTGAQGHIEQSSRFVSPCLSDHPEWKVFSFFTFILFTCLTFRRNLRSFIFQYMSSLVLKMDLDFILFSDAVSTESDVLF